MENSQIYDNEADIGGGIRYIDKIPIYVLERNKKLRFL